MVLTLRQQLETLHLEALPSSLAVGVIVPELDFRAVMVSQMIFEWVMPIFAAFPYKMDEYRIGFSQDCGFFAYVLLIQVTQDLDILKCSIQFHNSLQGQMVVLCMRRNWSSSRNNICYSTELHPNRKLYTVAHFCR